MRWDDQITENMKVIRVIEWRKLERERVREEMVR